MLTHLSSIFPVTVSGGVSESCLSFDQSADGNAFLNALLPCAFAGIHRQISTLPSASEGTYAVCMKHAV